MTKTFRIAILASGSGTNAERIIKYFKGHGSIEVALLLSNNQNAGALQRAHSLNIKTAIFTKEQFQEGSVILEALASEKITHIILAGFLWLIPEYLLQKYPDRIVNIHPALLPRHGGKGMYGIKVHEAVLAARDAESGITIHLVNQHYDEGKVLFQKRCDVSQLKSADAIASCVQKLEHDYFPVVIEDWIMSQK